MSDIAPPAEAQARALVCVPTYNERENVGPICAAIGEHLPLAHVLIADDASPDGTGDLADEIAARDPRVAVLHRAGKEGLGRAYMAAFREGLRGPYDYLIQMDADFSHRPSDLPRLLEPVARDELDLAIGSRYVPGGGAERWTLPRKLISRGGSLYARTVLGVRVRDLTGGFKCWHRRALEAIDLDTVEAGGFGFQIEMNYRAVRAGFRVGEIPIRFDDRRAGASKMSGRIFLEALLLVLRLRLRR